MNLLQPLSESAATNMPEKSPTDNTSQGLMSRSNVVAHPNISRMVLTRVTSQALRSWLNPFAAANISFVFVTRVTSHEFRSELKSRAFLNVLVIVVTADVLQPSRSGLNPLNSLESESKSTEVLVSCEVSQSATCPYCAVASPSFVNQRLAA